MSHCQIWPAHPLIVCVCFFFSLCTPYQCVWQPYLWWFFLIQQLLRMFMLLRIKFLRISLQVYVFPISPILYPFRHGWTYHRAFLYGCGCSEAILTYIPQDVDGLLHIHMFLASGIQPCGARLTTCTVPIHAFPGSPLSFFVDSYSVVFLQHHSSLPINMALKSVLHPDLNCCSYGNVFLIKHVGHNLQRY